jgi:hypothetical protein
MFTPCPVRRQNPRVRRASVLALAEALALPVAAASGRSFVFVTFRTPSGNIGCGYSRFAGEPAFLRCDIRSALRPRPARPREHWRSF